ncbi:MAG: serine/threonine protein kinase, partial [Victivallales bacterium]|nr:serine/threonine protein kinase [Victivallales bacterium]
MTAAELGRREVAPGRTAFPDGTKVRGYTLSFLATGGMSVVYKGEKDGKTYAVKEVQASNTREVPSLVSEKNLLERLEHPGILQYETFFNEVGYYFLITEYVPGHPLSEIRDGEQPTDPATIVDWGLQLCDIFSYLHRQNPPVIYRDLKSENILLSGDRVKLIDFGIARVHKGSRQKDTELMGSPATASPEHYGGAETDARSDIYTLGATLYELLSGGRRLQIGAFQFAPIRQLRPDVSPELEAVLAKALEFKPERRFQSIGAFGQALAKVAGKPYKTPVLERAPEGVRIVTEAVPTQSMPESPIER